MKAVSHPWCHKWKMFLNFYWMYTWVPASNAEGDERSHPEQSKWQRPPRWAIHAIKGIASLETSKSHVFLLIQISYPYIVWNNIPQVSEKLCEQFQKTEKITRTIPILTSNSTLFSFNFFFYDGYWNFKNRVLPWVPSLGKLNNTINFIISLKL